MVEVPDPLAPAATTAVPNERPDALATTTGDRLGAPRPPKDDSISRDAGEPVELAGQPRVARAEAATTAASPLWTPTGLLLLCWLALIAALLVIRHVHATV